MISKQVLTLALTFISICGYAGDSSVFPKQDSCELEIKSISGKIGCYLPMRLTGSTTNIQDLNSGFLSKFLTFKLPKEHREAKHTPTISLRSGTTKFEVKKHGNLDIDVDELGDSYLLANNGDYEIHIRHWKPTDYRIFVLHKSNGVVSGIIELSPKKSLKKR